MRRIFAIIGSLVVVVAMAAPAYAGNWAVTELDPLPDRIDADQAYTVGYWTLQHGTHPFEGPETRLGETGLRLTDEKGAVLEFIGSRLPEPAHYAVAVKIPKGTWRVQGIQGVFAEYEIGTLTVPGTLVPAPPQFVAEGSFEVTDYWGEIKPPGFPWKGTVSGKATMPAAQPEAPAAPVAAATQAAAQPKPAEAPASIPAYLLAVVAVAAVAGTLLVQRLRRPRVRPAGEPESGTEPDSGKQAATDSAAGDVLVIGGTKNR
ncbi:hypothetical protein Aph01nite_44510 [Acrocarpospora phusangensis]|uniref:Uncharacterized protein n=1 Tax=Acrocarpospora phusangensis TaxID=1070424 RepID=A0A919QC68_9ACTN|nr:hypothetical protein [Acrocarpospora phusangensis]GIH26141.1 hypothetical protein Aph01nite_44510 [Acrocarpospora phusangensis]